MSAENKKRKADISANSKRRAGAILFNLFLSMVALILSLVLIGVIGVSVYMVRRVEPRFDDDQWESTTVGASHLYYYRFDDRTNRVGERIPLPDGELNGGVLCKPVSYSELPAELIDAFVSIEDKRFWQHHGVDWYRTAAAIVNYCTGNRISGSKFGASTITQQLVKNLSGKNDYSVHRKIQEICWANDLENRCTKEEILERYLNVINLAQGCYGVGAAAEYYFGKPVSALTVTECATLAAITNNPSYYDPVRFPAHTQARRDLILREMRDHTLISEEIYEEAVNQPLTLAERTVSRTPTYSWYVDMVVEDVIRDLCAEYNYTREQANKLLWNGGLTIETAMNYEMQETVSSYYRQLANFPIHRSVGTRAQSAMIVMDPSTGDILAVAGAIGEKTGNRLLSHATGAVRPAASAIKPLSVYAPALEQGILTWGSVYDDVPVSFGRYNLNPAAGRIVKPVAWPQNANHVYRGLTDVRFAVAHSVNTVAVRVLQQLGVERSFDFLHDTLQMKSLIDAGTAGDGRAITDRGEAALALGQMNYGVTLRELTAGYTMLANGGVFVEPHSYYRVLAPDGRVLLSHPVSGHAAISEQNACIMTKLLENVVTEGTAKGAQILGGSVHVAGKTGTSNSDCDKWFIGYTPELLAGVWYGFPYPRALSDVKGNPAVHVFHDVMEKLVRQEARVRPLKREFPLSEGVIRVTYCRDSGKCPTDACRADVRGDRCTQGYFVQGTEPHGYCDCHVMREYDAVRHVPADENTCEQDRRKVGLIRVRRSFPRKIYVADEKYSVS